MPQDDSARVAPGSASDGVGVAEGAAAFLGGEGKGWQRAKYGGGDAGGEAVRKGAGEVAGGID